MEAAGVKAEIRENGKIFVFACNSKLPLTDMKCLPLL
jgi:hypothetical protein